MDFDASRAQLNQPDLFKRFRVPDRGQPLREAGLKPDDLLLVFERGGAQRALTVKQMIYHHLAQGTLAEQPYLITF